MNPGWKGQRPQGRARIRGSAVWGSEGGGASVEPGTGTPGLPFALSAFVWRVVIAKHARMRRSRETRAKFLLVQGRHEKMQLSGVLSATGSLRQKNAARTAARLVTLRVSCVASLVIGVWTMSPLVSAIADAVDQSRSYPVDRRVFGCFGFGAAVWAGRLGAFGARHGPPWPFCSLSQL